MASILSAANSVIPVITLGGETQALPLAQTLAAAGFPVLEITLRTAAGLAAIQQLAAAEPDYIVGAGTVLTAEQADAAIAAGAKFLVSPGFCLPVHECAVAQGVPYLPGVATISEAIAASALGYRALKLFPANVAGGPTMLQALHSVLPHLAFCPTGGIDAANLTEFLSLPNVVCVGGSWLAPTDRVEAADWQQIQRLAADCAQAVAPPAG
ncbi:MAG: bifunctional 4-hydroxy-2-oxoglutarate aldolase/2-dehydro-3-deoxy-phosphogluconate aldolase [Gammaproteobacteria bacterium]|nr:bifunctional 4-hydroxy-2-oxoglutarate aldolase/2-dehydro-3-deoxy-phosphogluconate aldolase [Gammaproteobacteria bacterium]